MFLESISPRVLNVLGFLSQNLQPSRSRAHQVIVDYERVFMSLIQRAFFSFYQKQVSIQNQKQVRYFFRCSKNPPTPYFNDSCLPLQNSVLAFQFTFQLVSLQLHLLLLPSSLSSSFLPWSVVFFSVWPSIPIVFPGALILCLSQAPCFASTCFHPFLT